MIVKEPKQVTLEEFRGGIFRLAGEDQVEADMLFQSFKEALIQDITLSINAKKKGKTEAQILFEKMKAREGRKHYRTLRRDLGARPVDTAAHHIVPWYDKEAEQAREILRHFGVNIDSKANGVYLPRFKKHLPHPKMKDSYAHSEVHTNKYNANITTLLLSVANSQGTVKEDIEEVLETIANELQQGVFPLHEEI